MRRVEIPQKKLNSEERTRGLSGAKINKRGVRAAKMPGKPERYQEVTQMTVDNSNQGSWGTHCEATTITITSWESLSYTGENRPVVSPQKKPMVFMVLKSSGQFLSNSNSCCIQTNILDNYIHGDISGDTIRYYPEKESCCFRLISLAIQSGTALRKSPIVLD